MTIDLAAVAQLRAHEGEMLARYLRAIEVERGDYNGRMLTIRRQDLTAITCIFSCHPDQVRARLDSLGLRLVGRTRAPLGRGTGAPAGSTQP